MPNPRKPIPSYHLSIAVPQEVAAQLKLHLYSEAEQRVPYAAQQRFIVQRMREFFEHRSLDLAPYLQGVPPGSAVRGPKEVVDALQLKLEEAFLVQS